MTTRRPQQAAAFALSLILTLAIFSSVSSLATPDPASPWLVQATAGTAHG
ncbi:MAG: hypothetical protein OEU93_03195 [Rubrivivax sp.]|nr:hypothetical protein [Rubrivivax sp.]MDH5339779.1 hypothetical protein [Rubrivivax sp.]